MTARLSQAQMKRAVTAMERAVDALAPLDSAMPDSTAGTLRSNLREFGGYLEALTNNKTSWLYRDGVLKP